jgi:Zn-dependent protease with chaperone function
LPAAGDLRRRRVFGLLLGLGTGGLGLSTAAILTATDSLHHVSATAAQIDVAGVRFTYPTLNGAGALLLLLGALGVLVIGLMLRSIRRQRHAYRSFAAQLVAGETLESDPRVNLIADPQPQAFCAGYLRPAVYVSRRTVELLSEAELEAVLAHEHHHRRVRDPLRLASGRILSEALFFVPALRTLCERYAELAELSADRAAVMASGTEAPLASALLVFDQSGPPGASGISPERVDSLLGQPAGWGLPRWLLAGSLAGVAALSLVIWLVSPSASARATFNLPILSSRPCLVLMTIAPAMACVRILRRARTGR